jgi:hypothetical protein
LSRMSRVTREWAEDFAERHGMSTYLNEVEDKNYLCVIRHDGNILYLHAFFHVEFTEGSLATWNLRTGERIV